MGDAAQRGLDAAEDDGDVGEELLEDLGVDDGGVLGTHVVTPVGAVGILGAQAAGGGVLVDHRVHAAGTDAEEEPWPTQLLEVAVVAVPVGLGHDGHAVACCLQRASYDGGAERGVVDVGIAREEDDVHLVPSAQLQLLLRRWQEVRQSGPTQALPLGGMFGYLMRYVVSPILYHYLTI